MKKLTLFVVCFLALVACKSGSPGIPSTPPMPANFSGTWVGDAGPIQNALSYGAKIEIQESAGNVTGEFFDEDPGSPGVYVQTGQIQGTRDGGTLYLTTGVHTAMGDAGVLDPQALTLSFDAGLLAGVRILQVPGQPPITVYVVLRQQ
jgi:hypothetical protein